VMHASAANTSYLGLFGTRSAAAKGDVEAP
jgi:hypothetical protein